MAPSSLPNSPRAFIGASWDSILPYYNDLAERPLTWDNVEDWLRDWSTLEELLTEAGALANVAYTTDTTDPAKEAMHLLFAGQIVPRMEEQRVRLAGHLLDLGYERPGLETLVRHFRNGRELFHEANAPLVAEEQELNARYYKITGSMTVEWDGEEKTLPQLWPYWLDPDRTVRERAFRLDKQPYIEQRDALADIFDRQYALRQAMARGAGFANYRDYAHRQKGRFDYTPADCERFHEAVEAAVVPAVRRLNERRQRLLGVATLRPWDLDCDPQRRPPLKPFDHVGELSGRAGAVFDRVDPILGGYFRTMVDEGRLDLDSRKGKAPGGYCTNFPHSKRPFIFMNAVGVAQAVNTLLHEAGHAFHTFEASAQPLLWQRHPGQEMGEVAAMAMELLAAPYLGHEEGGYYSAADTRRARAGQLQRVLRVLPSIALGDAFQHRLYTSGDGADRGARDVIWRDLSRRFVPGVDWDGLEAEQAANWHVTPHFFVVPFYFIEYGIAQFGALQIWRNSLRDPATALARYRQALALGGTQPLPRLFEVAGARLTFDAATMHELVTLVEEQLAVLEG